jgi:Zn-finger nucleic acid-binding protein
MTERHGIEVDYCPKCRGVWLDRGELDKIIERSAGEARPSEREERRSTFEERDEREFIDPEHRHDPRYKKKRSFLGELFDFD